jgi:hypothetical protein
MRSTTVGVATVMALSMSSSRRTGPPVERVATPLGPVLCTLAASWPCGTMAVTAHYLTHRTTSGQCSTVPTTHRPRRRGYLYARPRCMPKQENTPWPTSVTWRERSNSNIRCDRGHTLGDLLADVSTASMCPRRSRQETKKGESLKSKKTPPRLQRHWANTYQDAS